MSGIIDVSGLQVESFALPYQTMNILIQKRLKNIFYIIKAMCNFVVASFIWHLNITCHQEAPWSIIYYGRFCCTCCKKPVVCEETKLNRNACMWRFNLHIGLVIKCWKIMHVCNVNFYLMKDHLIAHTMSLAKSPCKEFWNFKV